MHSATSLASEINNQLPAAVTGFLKLAGSIAQSQGQNLYLVGGVVRDILLGRANLDLDLVVDRDAAELLSALTEITGGKVTAHPQFRTAKLKWDTNSTDITTARTETYDRPGALPRVKPGTLSDDLFRRDFTINAMAIHLNPGDYGKLVDLYGGRTDLKNGLVRVLHEKSFTDDATRIWRGLRYEQRLGFHLEAATLKLLRRDIPMLKTITGERIRYELECIFQEAYPENVLSRAQELNALTSLGQALKGDDWLKDKFKLARRESKPDPPSFALYLALLLFRLTVEDTERLISYLRPSKPVVRVVRETQVIKTLLPTLAEPDIPASRIYRALHSYSPSAATAASTASNSPVASRHIELYLSRLRHVRPGLNGNDLIALGVTPGPQIKKALGLLLEARLDGKAGSRNDEVAMVREQLAANHFM